MSITPANAPYRPAYVRDSDGLYYRLGGEGIEGPSSSEYARAGAWTFYTTNYPDSPPANGYAYAGNDSPEYATIFKISSIQSNGKSIEWLESIRRGDTINVRPIDSATETSMSYGVVDTPTIVGDYAEIPIVGGRGIEASVGSYEAIIYITTPIYSSGAMAGYWKWTDTVITGSPGPPITYVGINNVSPSLANIIYISQTQVDGNNANWLSVVRIGDIIVIRPNSDELGGAELRFTATDFPDVNAYGYATLNVTYDYGDLSSFEGTECVVALAPSSGVSSVPDVHAQANPPSVEYDNTLLWLDTDDTSLDAGAGSVTPASAPIRPTYVRNWDGLYYRVGDGGGLATTGGTMTGNILFSDENEGLDWTGGSYIRGIVDPFTRLTINAGTELKLTTGSNNVEIAPGASGYIILRGLGITVFSDLTFNTGKMLVAAPTTAAAASIRLPHGTAPSAPWNGDVWTTTAGIYVRINGATVGPLGSGGGGVTAHSALTGLANDDHTQYFNTARGDARYPLIAHTHTQAQSHNTPDTDSAPTALHHTLGTGANQAAAGSHTHTAAAVGAEPAGAVATHAATAGHELMASTTPAALTPDIAGAVGVGTTVARADHVHNVPAAAPTTNLTATTTNAEGSGTSFARNDHTHAIDTAVPVALGAANAVGTSTSLARADHIHIYPTAAQVGAAATSHTHAESEVTNLVSDLALKAPLSSPSLTGTPLSITAAVDTNTTQIATTAFVIGQASSVAPAALGTATVGVSLRYARSDHVHIMPTAAQVGAEVSGAVATHAATAGHELLSSTTPAALGTAAVGVGTTTARADHVHAMPTAAAVGAEVSGAVATHDALATAHSALRGTATPIANDAGTAVVGVANKFAREDHKHSITVAAPVALGAANAAGSATTLARSDHVHIYPTAANVGALDQATADSRYVNITGGETITGDLTISAATSQFNVIGNSGFATIGIDGPATQNNGLEFKRGGPRRWFLSTDASVESGSNSGSNLALFSYTDAGGYKDQVLFVSRSSGQVTIQKDLSVNGSLFFVAGNTQINGQITIGSTTNLNEDVVVVGDIYMNNTKIKSLATPTVNTDAANKKYVDDTVAAAGGGTLGGGFDIPATAALTPVVITHNLGTLDVVVTVIEKTTAAAGAGAGEFVGVTTKALTINTVELTFTSAIAVNKYRAVINKGIAGGASGLLDQATADGLYVNINGDTMTENLLISNAKALQLADATNPTTPDYDIYASGGNLVFKKTGGSSILTLDYNDANDVDISNSLYVHGSIWLDGTMGIFGVLQANSSITMVNNNKITNLGTPTANTDAATKGYVDNASGALNSIVPNLWTGAFTYCNFTTLAYAAGAARIFRMKTTQSFKTVQIEVTALGASGKCRIGVYSDTATGPGTLQSQTADISTAAVGVVQAAITIPAGTWWLMLQNTGASAFTLRSVLGDNPYSSGLLAPGTNSTQSAFSQGGLGTTLANGWTAAGQSNAAAPITYLQAA